MLYKALTQEEVEELRRIRHKYTLQQLCEMFYVSESVIKKACKGMNIKRRRPPLDKKQVAKIEKYRRYGWTIRRIANFTGMSTSTVGKYCKGIRELGKEENKLPVYRWTGQRMELIKK